MVAPVVLLTVGGIISNGLLTVYSGINDRMRDMTRERLQIRRGPAGELLDADAVPPVDQERLHEIGVQLPLMVKRHKLTRASLLVIFVALVVLGLSIVVIAIAANLLDKRITLMGSDMDEAPMAYKDIHTVMAAQTDLVEVLAKFEPRIVRMADAKERPED